MGCRRRRAIRDRRTSHRREGHQRVARIRCTAVRVPRGCALAAALRLGSIRLTHPAGFEICAGAFRRGPEIPTARRRPAPGLRGRHTRARCAAVERVSVVGHEDGPCPQPVSRRDRRRAGRDVGGRPRSRREPLPRDAPRPRMADRSARCSTRCCPARRRIRPRGAGSASRAGIPRPGASPRRAGSTSKRTDAVRADPHPGVALQGLRRRLRSDRRRDRATDARTPVPPDTHGHPLPRMGRGALRDRRARLGRSVLDPVGRERGHHAAAFGSPTLADWPGVAKPCARNDHAMRGRLPESST